MGKLINATYTFMTRKDRSFKLDCDTSPPYESGGPVKKPPKKEVVTLRKKK
jgi:hypothetical protein